MNEAFVEKYGLVKDVDTWVKAGQHIITMTGIYKIINYHDINFDWTDNLETRDNEGVAIRITAEMQTEFGLKQETMYGEANAKNCNYPYYWAGALNRGKARSTLMLIGAYGKKGYYMEEEAQAFENQKPTLKEIGEYTKMLKDLTKADVLTDEYKDYIRSQDTEIRNNKMLYDNVMKELREMHDNLEE